MNAVIQASTHGLLLQEFYEEEEIRLAESEAAGIDPGQDPACQGAGQAVGAPDVDPSVLDAPKARQRSIHELLRAGGWSPSDVITSVFYIGVDFEYRRWEMAISPRSHSFFLNPHSIMLAGRASVSVYSTWRGKFQEEPSPASCGFTWQSTTPMQYHSTTNTASRGPRWEPRSCLCFPHQHPWRLTRSTSIGDE